MDLKTKRMIAGIMWIAGTILMLAMALNVMARNTALFASLACYIVGGFIFVLPGKDGQDDEDTKS